MSHASVETRKKSASAQAATHRESSRKVSSPGGNRWNGVDREGMIAVAAYYIAEHRGFDGGDPLTDWLAAEAEVDAALIHTHQVPAH